MEDDTKAWFSTLTLALSYIGFCTVVGRLRVIPSKLSRKLMHIGKQSMQELLAVRTRCPCDVAHCGQFSVSDIRTKLPVDFHVGVGTLYLLCWPLYTSSSTAAWLCATVPLLATLYFWLVGTGTVQDESLVAAATVRTRACALRREREPST
jgi:hypothetical protein